MAEYIWKAQYNDGTILTQVEEDGTKNAYSSIDNSKLLVFELWAVQSTIPGPSLSVIFDGDGDKLVWTRRVFNSANSTQAFHIVGKKGEFILALAESGTVIVRHTFKDDGLFDEVVTN